MTILPMILFVYLVVFRVSVYFRMGNQCYGVSCLTLELFNILTRFFAVRGSNWEGATGPTRRHRGRARHLSGDCERTVGAGARSGPRPFQGAHLLGRISQRHLRVRVKGRKTSGRIWCEP